MRVVVTRSGGFAGRTVRRIIDTSRLPSAAQHKIESLVAAARKQPPPRHASPDSFQYEIEIDGERYDVSDGAGAWRILIEMLMTVDQQ
jgi:hypothetical protein